MNRLINIDRDLAETFWGWKEGRPTISRRVGGVISRIAGVTPEAGTDLFHLGLFVGALFAIGKKR